MTLAVTTLLIVFLPLVSFVLLGVFGRRFFSKAAGAIATLLMTVSAALAIYIAWRYYFVEGKTGDVYQTIMPFRVGWLAFSNGLAVDMGLLLDPISVMMLVVITFVSLMVHIFSLSYMKGEERYSTYFAFLGLFAFSMLGLVLSSNILQLYMFWELVGVSSYLLIGFYYSRPGAVAAAKKAFIVTRFADVGFLIGILVLSFYSNTLDFNTLIHRLTDTNSNELKTAAAASFLGISAITWGTALVFMGGAGKSALFPLHVWLPDAMEGPTPVSALIHAATMVVAGVYLVARLFPVFAISTPGVLRVIAYVGAISAAFAAIIACTQKDIKRILAYSTMSQIGYMMLGLGVARFGGDAALGYTASMFHLFTHALFKALLFLAAGVVIHAVHSNDMEDMGGLRRTLPVTHITFAIACLAISGIPPFSGFFSKEEILYAAYSSERSLYWIGLIVSGITAFYMFRLFFSVFWNRSAANSHHGEGGWTMMLPLVILAGGSVVAGFIPFGDFVSADGRPLNIHPSLQFSIAPVGIAIAGITGAAWLYLKQNERPRKLAGTFRGFYNASVNKFYIDEGYLFVTKKILFNLVGAPAAWFDKHIVDGAVNATGKITEKLSEKIRGLQSGRLQQYAVYFLGGAIVLAGWFILKWIKN